MATISACMMFTDPFTIVTRQDSSLVLSCIHATRASYLLIRDIAWGPIRGYGQETNTGKDWPVWKALDPNVEAEVQGRVYQSKVVDAYHCVGGRPIG